MYFNLQLAYKS